MVIRYPGRLPEGALVRPDPAPGGAGAAPPDGGAASPRPGASASPRPGASAPPPPGPPPGPAHPDAAGPAAASAAAPAAGSPGGPPRPRRRAGPAPDAGTDGAPPRPLRPPPGPASRPSPAAPDPPAPVWFRADGAGLFPHPADPARIAAWEAEGGGPRAAAVPANPAGTRRDPGPPPALAFAAGVNGGLGLAGAVAAAECCGFGALLRPGRGGAGTILTLCPATGAYLCLAARGGRIAAGLNGGGLDLALPDPGGWLLVLCGIAGGAVRLSVNGGAPAAAAAGAPLPAGPADLYIGCRGPRPGLTGKLGSFRLTDVLLWPGADPFADPAAPAAALSLWRRRATDAP